MRSYADKAIDSGVWVKTQIEDKKAAEKKVTTAKSKSDMILGLRLCGSKYMDAYQFYWDLGEYYFSLVQKNKGILPAAKACYIIGIENLLQINQVLKDEEQKKANNKKINDLIKL